MLFLRVSYGFGFYAEPINRSEFVGVRVFLFHQVVILGSSFCEICIYQLKHRTAITGTILLQTTDEKKLKERIKNFLISNFLLVLNVVGFLLGNSPLSEVSMPTFQNTLSVPSSYANMYEE
jgi:hypothetical protein